MRFHAPGSSKILAHRLPVSEVLASASMLKRAGREWKWLVAVPAEKSGVAVPLHGQRPDGFITTLLGSMAATFSAFIMEPRRRLVSRPSSGARNGRWRCRRSRRMPPLTSLAARRSMTSWTAAKCFGRHTLASRDGRQGPLRLSRRPRHSRRPLPNCIFAWLNAPADRFCAEGAIVAPRIPSRTGVRRGFWSSVDDISPCLGIVSRFPRLA